MGEQAFDAVSEAFEAMIDWDKRLKHEAPFYRRLLERLQGRRVVDVACGTGHHAAMIHSWGLEVEGADVSAAMIERCRSNCGEPAGLRWVVRGYDQPIAGEFDLAMCVGNSLALAASRQTIEQALGRMLAGVRRGGAALIHTPNLWGMSDGMCQWQKCLRAKLSQGESLIVKGVHRAGDRGFVDMLVTRLEGGSAELKADCVPFWLLEAAELERMAHQAGAGSVEVFGNYKGEGYERARSTDLIVVAIKG